MTRRCDLIRLAASNSFTAGEIEALDLLVRTLLRGGDTRQLARHPALASLARKVVAMKKSVARKLARRMVLSTEIGRPDFDRWTPRANHDATDTPALATNLEAP